MVFRALVCFVVAASWGCISTEANAQRTLQNADAFVTDLPPDGEQAPSVPVPLQLRTPGELPVLQSDTPPLNTPSLNSQLNRPPYDDYSSQVPSQFANQRQSIPTPQGGFNVRLAQAPKMLGDFFGRSSTNFIVDNAQGDPPTFDLSIPAGGPTDLTGRLRVHDNNSALPQDRVYLDYSYFKNAKLLSSGVDVNRFAPGFEKTFGNGIGSVEIRMPMASTLDSNYEAGFPNPASNFELGSLGIITKLLLYVEKDWVLAAGLGISVPTGDDLRVSILGANGLNINNKSVHLLPYLAWAYSPRNSSAFAHAFLTFDFDTNGAEVFGDQGTGFDRFGTWNDQNLVTFNVAYGSWLYENRCRHRCNRLQGIAWSAELHYTATLNDPDVISSGKFILGDPTADLSLLNATIGVHAEVGKTTYTAGFVTPLTSDDRVFDGELRLFANRAF